MAFCFPIDVQVDEITFKLFKRLTRWWFHSYFLCSSLFGEDEPNLTHIFHMGWFNHQPVDDEGKIKNISIVFTR